MDLVPALIPIGETVGGAVVGAALLRFLVEPWWEGRLSSRARLDLGGDWIGVWQPSGTDIVYHESIHSTHKGLKWEIWNEKPPEGSEERTLWDRAKGILWKGRCRVSVESRPARLTGRWEGTEPNTSSDGVYFFKLQNDGRTIVGVSAGWGKEGGIYRDWGVICRNLTEGMDHMKKLINGTHPDLNKQ